jgi:hypothetical protein
MQWIGKINPKAGKPANCDTSSTENQITIPSREKRDKETRRPPLNLYEFLMNS